MQQQRKWYVFDKHDCIDNFKTAAEAAAYADDLVNNGWAGVHIACMTVEQFVSYCNNNNLQTAWDAE